MEEIAVQLFGIPEIRLGDEKIRFPYKKAEAFFYYLCVRKKVSRDQVICLLGEMRTRLQGRKSAGRRVPGQAAAGKGSAFDRRPYGN